MSWLELEEKLRLQVSHIIDEEVEARLKAFDLYDTVVELNHKIVELKEENEKLKSLEPWWLDFLILFLPMLFWWLIWSFLWILIYNLLI